MTRTRKWLLGGGIAVAVLVVAIGASLGWLLYTPSGLRFVLDRGVAVMDGRFAYASASGTLTGEATIAGFHYRAEGGDTLRVKRTSLHLAPWELFTGRLHIRRARLDGVHLDLVPAKPSSQSGGLSLRPPLTVVLGDMRLTHIVVEKNGRPAFTAASLTAAGSWSRRRLVVKKLTLRAPAGSAHVEGTLALGHGERGRATATIDWSYDQTRYVGTLAAHSDGTTAHLRAVLTAPLHLNLDAALALNPHHTWTMTLDAPTFDARALPALPASLHTLAVNLRGSGDADGGQLTGTLAANHHVVQLDPARFRYDRGHHTLTLDPLRLRSPSIPGVVDATGVVHLGTAPMRAALDASWQGVQLPPALVGQRLATHGDVHVSGSAERFALRGALAIGPPGKLAKLRLDLTGTPRSVQVNALQLVQKHGGLAIHGHVALQPKVRWKLAVAAKKFDPGTLLAGWNGALDFALATQGELTANGPDVTLKLDHVHGKLRGRSIAGSKANLRITRSNLLDGTLDLVAGNSRIRATGKPGSRTEATVKVDVASLGDWLPGAAGQVRGQFTVRGVWPELAVAGTLDGKALAVGASRIDTLRLTASIPDVHQPGGDLDLALTGVHAAGLDFDAVHLRGSGTAASQHLRLTANGKPLGVTLELQGGWHARTRRWAGTLSEVELRPAGMPAWRQEQPSAVTWQHGAAKLSQLCLGAGQPRLCLSGARTARGVITAQYTLQRLPLQLLAALVSSAKSLRASGQISGSGQIQLGANRSITGHASLAVSKGSIALAATAGQPLLAWSAITLDGTAAGDDLHASLHGALAEGGHLDGTVDVHGTQRALGGQVDADLRSLAALSALSPEIANVKGSLAGNLRLGGTLSAPQFAGRIQTHDFSADLPRAGLQLRGGEFSITGDARGRLAIAGHIQSGQGVLHVKGTTGLAADAPLALTIEGQNVLVADIPAAHVLASPDLHIARANGVFTLTGSVTIPSATLKVEELPGQGPIHASPDVVIVDAPPKPPTPPLAMNAEIEVKLGNKVRVQGYGFHGRVHGQLAVRVQPDRVATGRGQIVVTGKYQAYGQNLTIDNGRLLFAGTRLDDPGLDLRAVRHIRAQDVTVGLNIGGTAQQPVLTVFSDPAMDQAEALSYLVTGRPLSSLNSGESNTLDTAAQALGGLAGNRLAKSIGARIGLQTGVSNSEALGGSAFTAGKYLSPRLFMSYGVGLFTPGQVITLRYTLNRFLQFEAENATTGNRASLNYRIEK